MATIQEIPLVTSFLNEAKETARQVLGSASTSYANPNQTNIHHHHHHDYWGGWGPRWGWYQPTPCYYPSPAADTQSTRKERTDYSWLALPALIIGLGTAYFLGKDYSEYKNATRKIEKLLADRRQIPAETGIGNLLWKQVDDIALIQLDLLHHQKADALNGLRSKTALAASTAITLAGAIINSGALIAAGVIGGAAAGAFMLFKSGMASSDNSLHSEAIKLQTAVSSAELALEEVITKTKVAAKNLGTVQAA